MATSQTSEVLTNDVRIQTIGVSSIAVSNKLEIHTSNVNIII